MVAADPLAGSAFAPAPDTARATSMAGTTAVSPRSDSASKDDDPLAPRPGKLDQPASPIPPPAPAQTPADPAPATAPQPPLAPPTGESAGGAARGQQDDEAAMLLLSFGATNGAEAGGKAEMATMAVAEGEGKAGQSSASASAPAFASSVPAPRILNGVDAAHRAAPTAPVPVPAPAPAKSSASSAPAPAATAAYAAYNGLPTRMLPPPVRPSAPASHTAFADELPADQSPPCSVPGRTAALSRHCSRPRPWPWSATHPPARRTRAQQVLSVCSGAAAHA